jgi:hypothetical protein
LEGLGALPGVLVCRQRHDKYAVVSEKKLGTRAEVGSYLEKWRMVAVNRVCEAFELVKEAEMERFGEKFYFDRKMNGLSPADSDDDPDPVGDDVHGHGFEEPEEEEDIGTLEGEAMEVDTDEM